MKKTLIAVALVFLSGACSTVQPSYGSSYSCSITERKPAENSSSHLLWSRAGITVYPDRFTSFMQGVDSKVFVVTGKDIEYGGSKILALDSLSGNVLWHRDVVLPSGIITNNTQLYTGMDDKIEVIDPQTGNPVKVIEVPKVGSIYNIFATESNLYASTKSGRWLTYNIHYGVYSLSGPFLPYIPFLVENGILYFSEAGTYKSKDTETQSIFWEYPLPEIVNVHPLFADNVIIIIAKMGGIYGLDKKTGNLLWNVDAHVISNIATNKSQLYFLTNDGYLKVLDINSGQEITKLGFVPASFELNSPVIGAYDLWVDSQNDIVVVSFGDSCQLMGIKLQMP